MSKMKRGDRVFVVHNDIQMEILGDTRPVREARVSYVKDGNGGISRTMSFDEFNRIGDEIHRQLRAKRKVYSERE